MASSRSACWIGDSTPCARVARQDARSASMAASWASVSLDGAQRACRLLGVLQAVLEQRGASFDRGGRVVQLVGQSSGQLSERDHLLVLQAARREDPGAIEHLVHEDRRDLMTVANHRGEVVARDRENLRGLLGDRVAGRTDQARVGEHARHVPSPPLHHLVPPGAAIDEDGDVARQHDEEARHRRAFRAQHLSFVEMSKRAVRRPATRAPRAAPRRGSCARRADRRDPLRSRGRS